jgi:hypothetical protein
MDSLRLGIFFLGKSMEKKKGSKNLVRQVHVTEHENHNGKKRE